MPEVICNTSPFQYLHQLGALHILPSLAGQVTAPPAVVEELAVGRRVGIDVPDLTGLNTASPSLTMALRAPWRRWLALP